MKSNSVTRLGAALSVTAVALSGIAAAPAVADPKANTTRVLVGTGSDTTQDVLNGLSTAIGYNSDNELMLASYDAISTNDRNTDFIYPAGLSSAIARPNGSGQGRDVLRTAIGQTGSYSGTTFAGTTATWTTAQVKDTIDFARSSSSASSADLNSAGVLTYIPFAIDGMTYAVSSNSVIPANLSLGTASVSRDVDGVVGKVSQTLFAIYTCAATQVVDEAGTVFLADNTYAGSGTTTPIHAYIPQSGSGTRSYWIGKFGLTEATITSTYTCLSATSRGGDHVGSAVQEHSGFALQGDAGAITPFSIPQWVGQANRAEGVVDRRFGAVLGSVNSVSPTTGSGTSYTFNSAAWISGVSALKRSMYNIVPSALADDATSDVYAMFVGANSAVCQATAAIQAYGFGIDSTCGATTMRAYAPSIPTIVGSVQSATGSTITVKGVLTSNGNGGATVNVMNGSTQIGTFQIAAGATEGTTDINVADIAAGTDLTLAVVPNLSGVDEATSAAFDVKEAATASGVLTTSTVRLAAVPKVRITVAGAADTIKPTGTVKVRLTSATGTIVGTATLVNGVATVNLRKFARIGTYRVVVTYDGDSNFFAANGTSSVLIRVVR
ncbi:MAG: hypothetical protein RIS25_775 [Actinomycetota bacterium]